MYIHVQESPAIHLFLSCRNLPVKFSVQSNWGNVPSGTVKKIDERGARGGWSNYSPLPLGGWSDYGPLPPIGWSEKVPSPRVAGQTMVPSP